MNWKLIIQLSVFGLIMAIATVSLIPQTVEPVFWLVIFGFCAYTFAKVGTGKYFLHGFLLSLANCIWIVLVHVLFYNAYMQHHPDMAALNSKMPPNWAVHPRLIMVVTGPFIGIVSGLIQGLFSFIASKIVKKRVVAAQ